MQSQNIETICHEQNIWIGKMNKIIKSLIIISKALDTVWIIEYY